MANKQNNKNFYMFSLVDGKTANIDALAEKIIKFKDVEEVYVTDADHGFLVKTRFARGREPKDMDSYIKRNIGSAFGHIDTCSRQ